MFIARDKLAHQGLKQAIIVVPERSIGASFHDEPLSQSGFWADWKMAPKWNLCDAPGTDNGGKVDSVKAFLDSDDKVLVCTHASFRLAVDKSRVAHAKKDPTYPLADVEIAATFKLANVNRKRLEALLHRFFGSARLDLELKDRFGAQVEPREWFLLPLTVIEEAMQKLKEGTIGDHRYDEERAEIVRISRQFSGIMFEAGGSCPMPCSRRQMDVGVGWLDRRHGAVWNAGSRRRAGAKPNFIHVKLRSHLRLLLGLSGDWSGMRGRLADSGLLPGTRKHQLCRGGILGGERRVAEWSVDVGVRGQSACGSSQTARDMPCFPGSFRCSGDRPGSALGFHPQL